jgi:hypothetical protein
MCANSFRIFLSCHFCAFLPAVFVLFSRNRSNATGQKADYSKNKGILSRLYSSINKTAWEFEQKRN